MEQRKIFFPDDTVTIVSDDEELPSSFSSHVLTPTVSKFFTLYRQRSNGMNELGGDVIQKPDSKEQTSNVSIVRWGRPLNDGHFKSFRKMGHTYSIGDFVSFREGSEFKFGRIAKLFNKDGSKWGHFFKLLTVTETIISYSNDRELFSTLDCFEANLSEVIEKIDVEIVANNEAEWRSIGGSPHRTSQSYQIRLQFSETSGRYERISASFHDFSDVTKCSICSWKCSQREKKLTKIQDGTLIIGGVTFRVNDGVLLTFGSFPVINCIKKGFEVPHPKNVDEKRYPEHYRYFEKGTYLKGDHATMPDPLQIGLLKNFQERQGGHIWVKIRPLYRPENTSLTEREVLQSDPNLLFLLQECIWIKACHVEGKCIILPKSQIVWREQKILPRFYYEKSYCPFSRTFHNLTAEDKRLESSQILTEQGSSTARQLRTLDLFSGCGGLSKGLENSRCAKICWAIETDYSAAKAFSKNHKSAKVYQEDANDFLQRALNGKESLMKGDIDLICTGPPCQGFSGLNSFRSGEKAAEDNAQVATALSFVDYYRPDYFLMENVKRMVSHQSGLFTDMIVRTLTAIGYQVCVGVLQAGNYWVAQDRQRAFILAASPFVQLPLLPEPQTVFIRSSNKMRLGSRTWTFGPQWKSSAPYRNLTTRDAIADLPRIHSGTPSPKKYATEPLSSLQKVCRWDESTGGYISRLTDHETKPLSALDKVRISLIPTRPGSDWRDLPNIVWEFPNLQRTEKIKYLYNDGSAKKICHYKAVCPCMQGKKIKCNKKEAKQKMTIIPWSMIHTARRNNHWTGCFGRVAWQSYFSTVTTDPKPDGKQGRVVHPDRKQKRVISVRESARAQGFPDSFVLCGDLSERYRQVGNAVPPPLAEAIGLEIARSFDGQSSTTS